MSRTRFLLAAFALLAFGPQAQATLLPVNSGTVPLSGGPTGPDLSVFGSGTVLATLSGNYTGTNAGVTISGSYVTSVVRNTAGFLDFAYQATVGPGAANDLARLTAVAFPGTFTTDVFALSSTLGSFLSGGVAPTSGNRTVTTVGFNFTPLLLTGAQTQVLVIRTNATIFTSGGVNFIDGAVASVAGFAPAVVPEPMTLASAVFGLPLAGLLLRKRRKS